MNSDAGTGNGKPIASSPPQKKGGGELPPFWGNLEATLKFWAPIIFFVENFLSCLVWNDNFLSCVLFNPQLRCLWKPKGMCCRASGTTVLLNCYLGSRKSTWKLKRANSILESFEHFSHILSLRTFAHLTILSLSNPVLNLTFSLLPITASHPHASASDSTFDYIDTFHQNRSL